MSIIYYGKTHLGCGGVVLADGAVCIRCGAENLAPEDVSDWMPVQCR